jgi:hypothetical protein
MRRIAFVCTAAILACGQGAEKSADSIPAAAPPPAPPPKAIALADVAGTWELKAKPMNKDTVVLNMEITATSATTGWKMKLPNGANPAVTVGAVQGDSIVTDAGPFKSALRKGQQVTVHTVFRMQDGNLVGIAHTKYANGDTATLRLEGMKKTSK